MEGTRVMYRMKPVFELPEKIELPTCMYPMKNIVNPNINHATCDNNEILNSIMDKKPSPELQELEKRWDKVLDQLNELVAEVNTIKQQIGSGRIKESSVSQITLNEKALENLKAFDGAVINVNPLRVPYSLILIKGLCNNYITFTSHVHSSVNSLPENLNKVFQSETNAVSLQIRLIWKTGITDSELVLNPVKQLSIRGEVNILRHLGRMGLELLKYPSDVCQTIHLESILDVCHRLQHTQAAKEVTSLYRNLNAKLGRNPYFGGESFNISDIAVWSVLKQNNVDVAKDLTPNMGKWFKKMDEMYMY